MPKEMGKKGSWRNELEIRINNGRIERTSRSLHPISSSHLRIVGARVFMYALDPSALDFLGGLITDIHSRLHRMSVYQYLPFSKLVTVMLVIITCIGTKNKKQLELMPERWSFGQYP